MFANLAENDIITIRQNVKTFRPTILMMTSSGTTVRGLEGPIDTTVEKTYQLKSGDVTESLTSLILLMEET